jgi:hypothetical protein
LKTATGRGSGTTSAGGMGGATSANVSRPAIGRTVSNDGKR